MDILAISATKATLEFIDKGGIFMYPLVLCSITGLTAIGFKAMSLGRSRTVPDGLARGMAGIGSGDSDLVVRQINQGGSALARSGAGSAPRHCACAGTCDRPAATLLGKGERSASGRGCGPDARRRT
jgi:hypothetical protein